MNRPGYTSGKRAASYCGRGLAEQVSHGEMRMLEAAELALVRQEQRTLRSLEDPKFAWYVGESGGSAQVKDLSGHSTGWRLWNADGGDAKPENPKL